MKLVDTRSIRQALKEAERDGMYLYIQLDEADKPDVWARVFRVRNYYNGTIGHSYPVVETMAGTKIAIRSQHGYSAGHFDIR